MKKFSIKKVILSAAVAMAVLGTGIAASSTFENTAKADSAESTVTFDGGGTPGKTVMYNVATGAATKEATPTFSSLKDATHINVYIDPGLTDAEVKAVLAATQSWSYAAQKLNFYLTTDPSQAQIKYLTGNSQKGTVGMTTTHMSNGHITYSDVHLNLSEPNNYNNAMVCTLIHETGHALGLDDNYDMETSSVMYGVASQKAIDSGITPKMYDINNIDNLYGF
ncbi:snapalysin family zinc-dependent metalloprotease [Companilactobacillus mishanensis]|uniref:snapalysin family zinc-dependent metalloprotease n=1 Tax=Companilactobacillus mishanensis TaxID=2486008 RepID=UPI001294FAE3|nr:snapalysin family zinc-dependent metalloprotease [Companilactobacillus mishanensis]MQS89848.1 snapalysin family zinc-dependent metalloprotease [Companilactobacillus mishanensis]